jgi:class 3 adenylate cyclase
MCKARAVAATTASIRYAASSDDVHIAYRVVGDGPVDLLVLPGFVSHLEVLYELRETARLVDRLARFARVILFDRRGQGLSDRPPVFTLEDHARDAIAVLDAAGSERAGLLGVSEGGPASILLAAGHPDRISHLAVTGSQARMVEAPDYPIGAPPAAIEALRRAVVGRWGEPVVVRLFVGEEAGADERWRAWWGRLLRSGASPAGVSRLIDTWFDIDVRDLLPAVRQPALVLQRTEDVLAPPAAGRFLAEHLPNARYVEIAGPHFPSVGDVEAFTDEIEELLTGRRHASEPDRMLATVLFTDIVGSTERASELGDRRWRDLLADHDAAVRTVVERFGGSEVKQLGDGFLLRFDGPARAVRAARAIVEAVRPLGLEVRTGVHTGECEIREGDLAGVAVHIGARVSAAAGASEVLVSGTVRDLVAGSGLAFDDRGERELKGVDGTWRLFALRDGG